MREAFQKRFHRCANTATAATEVVLIHADTALEI